MSNPNNLSNAVDSPSNALRSSNKISSLNETELDKGVVCASAGNHAQGVAYSCFVKKIKGVIFMPTPTPKPMSLETAPWLPCGDPHLMHSYCMPLHKDCHNDADNCR